MEANCANCGHDYWAHYNASCRKHSSKSHDACRRDCKQPCHKRGAHDRRCACKDYRAESAAS